MAKRKVRKHTADQLDTAAYELLCRTAERVADAIGSVPLDKALDLVVRQILTWRRRREQPRKRK
jgi:hypothetical protein